MRRARRSPAYLALSSLLVLAVVAGVLWVLPSSHYLFLPNEARPVAPYVKVRGERPPEDGGGIYFVDVLIRKASLLERLFP